MHVPLTPVRALYRAVDLFGKKVGVVCGERRFTYTEFGERCEQLAFGLLDDGVVPGDRVAFLSFNTHQLLEGYYGAPLVRAIVMPLNVRLTAAELTCILQHAEPKIVIYESDFAPLVEALRGLCPGVSRWIEAGAPYEGLLSRGRIQRPDIFTFNENEIAELFYTSGSTGTPKGVTLSHRTLYLHMLGVSATFYNDESNVELHTIPLFHANGWGRPQSSTMLGIKQVMVRRFETTQVFRLIQEQRATDMCVVPTMANSLINATDRAEWDLSSLRRVMIGGAASSPELVERVERAFPGCECSSGYGLTETSPLITMAQSKASMRLPDAERRERQARAGWAVVGASIRVVDMDMRDVPRDGQAIGEVITLSDHVMDGYFREPEATRAVMSGPWLHTGDMGVWDEDGYIRIVDRKKQIIISGGENISSIEVEAAIFAHPSVLECAVVAAPDEKWGEVPAAIIVLKPDESLTTEDLLAFLQQRLGKFKLPRIVEFSVEPLPKTGTGKIRKQNLRERFWTGKEKRVQG